MELRNGAPPLHREKLLCDGALLTPTRFLLLAFPLLTSQYGQSGEKRGEACKRYKASSGASLGGGVKVKSLGGAYAM